MKKEDWYGVFVGTYQEPVALFPYESGCVEYAKAREGDGVHYTVQRCRLTFSSPGNIEVKKV